MRPATALGLAALLALALAVACKGESGEAASCGPTLSGDGGDMTDGPPPVDIEPITTGSGLQYCDIEVGGGEAPEAADTITVHYTGWLEDGTKFDSSVDRDRPFTFQIGVGGVIRGWDEGVATMQVGGTRRLIIPSDLGYGATGSPPVIPPDATLIFDVVLLEIQ